jgi:hypothetical protein
MELEWNTALASKTCESAPGGFHPSSRTKAGLGVANTGEILTQMSQQCRPLEAVMLTFFLPEMMALQMVMLENLNAIISKQQTARYSW